MTKLGHSLSFAEWREREKLSVLLHVGLRKQGIVVMSLFGRIMWVGNVGIRNAAVQKR